MNAFKWSLSFLKKYRKRYLFGLFLVFVTSVLVLINPRITGQIVDDVILGGNYDRLGGLLVLMVGITVLLPFTLALTLSQRRRIRPAFANIRDHFSSLNAFVQENIAGNRVALRV